MLKSGSLLLYICIIMLFFSCSLINKSAAGKLNQSSAFDHILFADDIKIAVFTDPHLYDASLGISGTHFENYLNYSRKLIKESEALLRALVDKIKARDVDIVLIPGDLTKDGTRASHMKFSGYLDELEKSGKKVYVINGNHDILNPYAYGYNDDETYDAGNVSPDDFRSLYHDFGYGEALYQDANSLSYVVEPVYGLWVLAIDSCIYETGFEAPVSRGALSTETRTWISERLIEAQNKNKRIFAFMHHGMLEHFTLQEDYFASYVINDWRNISSQFGEQGLNVVFSGHFHAHDICKKELDNGKYILDVQTGSLVTYPCPYREITVTTDKRLVFESFRIDEIDYPYAGDDFQDYSRNYLMEGLNDILPVMLADVFMVDTGVASLYLNTAAVPEIDETISFIDVLSDAIIAHYTGDEMMDTTTDIIVGSLVNSSDDVKKMLGALLESIYSDLSPEDNNLSIDLQTGNVIVSE